MVLARLMETQNGRSPALAGRISGGLNKNDTYKYFSPEESCPYSHHPESRQFIFSPYVPGTFCVTVPLLGFRASICE